MNQKEQNNDEDVTSYNNWKLYELLVGILQHNHTRWVDNYRVFLSFNAFLLPAVTALFGYSIRENINSLRPFVFLVCIIAVIITLLSLGLLKRISIDAKLRLNQLNRIEEQLPHMPIHHFEEAHKFFFEKNDIEDFPQDKYKCKGIQAFKAYEIGSIAIIV